MSRILFNNINADAISDPFDLTGGPAVIIVRADNFGGGLVTLQMASIGDNLERFEALDNGTFTANGSIKIDYLPGGLRLRAQLAGASGSADNVFVEIKQ